ncbi:pyridine nucleotide-disulfide oxidoreductase, partial [bacterium]|nr:pyridine nucleotide-disulfide oxidoreductase [bacterium]
GVQGVGPGDVVKRIDVAATALTGGLTVDQVADLDLGYAPPFSEALDILIHGANLVRNKLDGTVAGLPAVDLKAMRDAGEDFVLVDVRTPGEFATGRLAGAVHIPLGALGSRSGELPRDRPLVLYCKSSLRAYEAYRILTGQGFEGMSILEGGLLAWPYEMETGD